MTPLLPAITKPADLAPLDIPALAALAAELRQVIIDTVSKNGGHLAPSLGVVELSIALCKVFDFSKDKLIWDVGHQAYAYKLLTGRLKEFHTLRTLGGLSGFPKPCESPYDHFAVGHSSTSISAGLGMAMARDLAGRTNKVVAVIGDGSMTAGLAFEGLNQAGHMDRDLIVILNDNEMSISPNVGALSSFLSRKMSSRFMQQFKKSTEQLLRQVMPDFSQDIVEYLRRSESSFRSFVTPGMLFEALHFEYLGPIDGHDLSALVDVLEQVKELEGPILVHVLTKKGKGYLPAEQNPTYFHGVGCFEPETGEALKHDGCVLPTYTEVFGETLCSLARRNPNIITITAAMPEGTGLACFARQHPERFVDVGICEQHAVTFAAGLASQGFRPVVAIYSTFLQRSYDQVVHDVCLQNLPVLFCLDRGGLVGEDGPTHHGAFDLAYLRHIPNLVLMAPKDEPELQRMLATALELSGPAAIRYPRGVGPGAPVLDDSRPIPPIPLGQGELLRDGADCADCCIIALGSRVYPALEAAQRLAQEGIGCAVLNARFVKPLPETMLVEAATRWPRLLIVEEGTRLGGFSSAVLECLADRGVLCRAGSPRIKRLGLPDRFIEHGPQKALRQRLGLDKNGIAAAVRALVLETQEPQELQEGQHLET
ncbi:MAG: 1-deoxy-D-xylulose-5-phosphate synthase [Desulfovibrio sp.]|nr:1-deoxy-D-xylulose-5-phosphate synthase [Desulfovibrio sp.]MCA1986912.1 1-deoxy-D-xylulose-5-phosphate synthase [Desulfovibrio sp.]